MWLGLKLDDSINPHSHFLQFNLCNAPNYVNLSLGNVCFVVISEIWCLKNKVIFKDEVTNHSKNFSLIQLKVDLGFLLKFPPLVFLIQIDVLNLWFVYTRFSSGFSLFVFGFGATFFRVVSDDFRVVWMVLCWLVVLVCCIKIESS